MERVTGAPYRRQALENLAVALGVDTAVIWYGPTPDSAALSDQETEQRVELDEELADFSTRKS